MKKLNLTEVAALALEGKLLTEEDNKIDKYKAKKMAGYWLLDRYLKEIRPDYHTYRGFKSDFHNTMKKYNFSSDDINSEIKKWEAVKDKEIPKTMQEDINDILYNYYSSDPNTKFWASEIDEYLFDWINNKKEYESIYFSIPKAIRAFNNKEMLYKARKQNDDIEDRLEDLGINTDKLSDDYIIKLRDNADILSDDALKFICKFPYWSAFYIIIGIRDGLTLEDIQSIPNIKKLKLYDLDEAINNLKKEKGLE